SDWSSDVCSSDLAANRVAVQRSNYQLWGVLKPQQHFVGMQAEVILEGWIDAGQHPYVRARRKKLVTGATEQYDVNVIVHAGPQDGLIELAIHFVGVSIRRRIIHLN